MPADLSDIARQVRALGDSTAFETIAAVLALYSPLHEQEPYRGVRVARDLTYGPDPRHRLDLFEPEERPDGEGAPVLVFVHGGGFTGGDKRLPGTPFHDNVALWAVRHGLLGVTMTYRLAPDFPWPAAAQDVAAVVQWVHANAPRFGGDPSRAFLMGTSAGAAHVGSYVSHPVLHPASGVGVAGAILLSGIYDLTTAEPGPPLSTYFGDDPARYAERSSQAGLLETTTPVLYGVAELDPPMFQRQALGLVDAYLARHGRWPHFVRLVGHNHFTAAWHLNTPDDCLGRQVLSFMQAAEEAGAPPRAGAPAARA